MALDPLLGGLGALAGAIYGASTANDGKNVDIGFQGEIPVYDYIREKVPDAANIEGRVAGSGGLRYFSDDDYVAPEDNEAASQVAFDNAVALRGENYDNSGIAAPALTQTGPKGSASNAGFDYSSRNAGPPPEYTVDDPDKAQFFPNGVSYFPDFGWFELGTQEGMSNFLASGAMEAYQNSLDGGGDDGGDDGGTYIPTADDVIAGNFDSFDDPDGTLDASVMEAGGYYYNNGVWYKETGPGTDGWLDDSNNTVNPDVQGFIDANQALISDPTGRTWPDGTTQQALVDAGYTWVDGWWKLDVAPEGTYQPRAEDVIAGGFATFNDPDQTLNSDTMSGAGYTWANGVWTKGLAGGGIVGLAKGGAVDPYLRGSTDGMADQVPATIGSNEPAALSDGEFVVPADVVSHFGNGNSEAGADVLYSMLDRVREARTGSTEQGTQINPNAFIPR